MKKFITSEPKHEMFVLIAYASSDGSDEPEQN